MRKNKLILVVEDDFGIRSTLAEVLRDEGYSVVEALDGAEALKKLRNGVRPQLILLDLMMTGMDGFEFRSHQLADPDLAHIPVVILSAMKTIALKERGLLAVEYLAKPISLIDLLETVEKHSVNAPQTSFPLKSQIWP